MDESNWLQIEWDIAIFCEKNGDIRPLLDFLYTFPGFIEGVDLVLLANVFNESIKKKPGRIKQEFLGSENEPYIRAAGRDVSMLATLLRENGIRGTVPDLYVLADILERVRKPGRPVMIKLTDAGRVQTNGPSVRAFMDGGDTRGKAIEKVAAITRSSTSLIEKEYRRWCENPYLAGKSAVPDDD